MQDIKIYKINFLRQLRLGFPVIFCLIIIIAMIYLVVWRLLNNDIIGFIFIPLIVFFAIIVYPPIKLFIQYMYNEENRLIEFNRIDNVIKVISKQGTIVIKPNNIEKIISHDFKGGFKNLCSEFEFFDIILKNSQKIRITSMIADLHNFSEFIDKLKIDRLFNRKNYIK